MSSLQKDFAVKEDEWNKMFAEYAGKYPELAKLYKEYFAPVPQSIFDDEGYWKFDKPLATRQSSGEVLNRLAAKLPGIIGGSADLAPSNNSLMKGREYFSENNRTGTNMHFGIREFAMAAISNGITLHGGLHAYCATFMVFSDYLKAALRLSALMKLPVTYILTHDSIGVGEDGPTHEPIEQMAMLRSIPDSYTFRPADSKETAAAYQIAFTGTKPTCIALTRQTLPLYDETGKGALRGGYILKDSKDAKVILIGTGSEVELCMKAYDELAAKGIPARVVSMPCTELFDEQSAEYKESVLPSAIAARVVVEAAWAYQHRPNVTGFLLRRQKHLELSEEAKKIAWKAQQRLHKRYQTMAARGKNKNQIVNRVGARTTRLHVGHRGGNRAKAETTAG
jgi:transketolase